MKNIFIVIIFCLFSFTSCDDFLQEYSQDLTYARKIEDLNELMVGSCYFKNTNMYTNIGSESMVLFTPIHVMHDDLVEYLHSNMTGSRDYLINAHHWQKKIFKQGDAEFEDKTWDRVYKAINILNVIIKKAVELEEADNNDIDKIIGECHYLRGWFHFMLVNAYAKPYCKDNLDEPGIPLKTSEIIEDRYFSRNSISEVYDLIVADLEIAAEKLKDKEITTVFRANCGAAYCLLSRVYLYMEDYEKSIKAANSALDNTKARLLDFNNYDEDYYFLTTSNPEVIMSNCGNNLPELMALDNGERATCYTPSEDFLSLFHEKDLRLKKFYNDDNYNARVIWMKSPDRYKNDRVSNVGTMRMAEIYLNRAEAFAMLDKEADAINDLNTLAANRFSRENVPDINLTGEELISYIRDERRRELCFEGHRWFDLRRYAVNSKYPFSKKIVHTLYQKGEGYGFITELVGYSHLDYYENDIEAYMLQIPEGVINFNKGAMKANPDRKEREITENK